MRAGAGEDQEAEDAIRKLLKEVENLRFGQKNA